MYKSISKNSNRYSRCFRRDNEIVVKNGLSITPAQMMKMAEHGIPVSASNEGMFNDGVENPDWNVPIDRCRGVDPAQLRQASKDIRNKVKSAHHTDVANYG